MPPLLDQAAAAITRLNHWIFRATVWTMMVVVPIMIYEVVARYFFGAPTVWAMELAVLLFGPYFLLGGPYLLHTHSHVALDLLRRRMNAAWNRAFDLMNYPVIIAFCAILLYYSVPPAWNAWEYRETSFSAWNPPIWPVKVIVPLAVALMGLQAIAEFMWVIFGRSTPFRGDSAETPKVVE